jgi:uncharacterized protein
VVVLRLSVSAAPERGRANAAAAALLAGAAGIPKRDVAIVSGQTARLKTLRLSGDPEQLIARLAPLLR